MGNTLCLRARQQSLGVEGDEPESSSSGQAAEAAGAQSPALEDAPQLSSHDLESDTETPVLSPAALLTTTGDTRNSFSQQLLVTTNTILSRPGISNENLLSKTPEEFIEDIQFLGTIGAGAFAMVFRGVYQGGDVAIKLAVMDGANMAWNEALLASQLRHPHVVNTFIARGAILTPAFYDVINRRNPQPPVNLLPAAPSEDGLGNPQRVTHERQGWRDVLSRSGAAPNKGLLMLVQEHCDMGTLSKAIRNGLFRARQGVRTEVVARRMLLRTATEICRAMIHLHAASVIHGDLKPANVLLTRSMADRRGFIAKIADFGLARLLESDKSRVESATMGTVAYMSPEAFNGTHSKAGDVYAFGMLLWEMVTCQRPYESMIVGQIMLGVSFHNLRPKWPEDLWPELCALGRTCLEQEAEERPTFRELERQLIGLEEQLRAESRRQSEESRRRSSTEQQGQQSAGLAQPQPRPRPKPQQGQALAAQEPSGDAAGSSGPQQPATPRESHQEEPVTRLTEPADQVAAHQVAAADEVVAVDEVAAPPSPATVTPQEDVFVSPWTAMTAPAVEAEVEVQQSPAVGGAA